jgi:hypothetical protein
MTAYDDDRVIALLRDAVPAVPDAPDRVSAVRHRARRQRAAIRTQVIGAVASVLLVVGLASAVAKPGGDRVEPTANPLPGMAEAYARKGSVSFRVTSVPVGTPDPLGDLTVAQVRDLLTSDATGSVARNGDGLLVGDMSAAGYFLMGEDPGFRTELRFVGGTMYRPVRDDGENTPRRQWVAMEDASLHPGRLLALLRAAGASARDVTYVRQGSSRGVPVAEYTATIPGGVLGTAPVAATFDVDADGLPRRVEADLDLASVFAAGDEELPLPVTPMRVHVEVEMFGYGEDVRVEAPPARVINEAEAAKDEANERVETVEERYEECPLSGAGPDKCFDELRAGLVALGCTVTGTARSSYTYKCPRGGSASRKGEVPSAEVSAAPGSPEPSGRPSPASVESPAP